MYDHKYELKVLWSEVYLNHMKSTRIGYKGLEDFALRLVIPFSDWTSLAWLKLIMVVRFCA
jgi:hypothetical protein